MNYKKCISFINKRWIKNRNIFLVSLIIPFFINLILSFTIDINDLLFVSMMNYLLFSNVLFLPIFINKIRNDRIAEFSEWSQSWKLTYWIPLYFFIYSVIISTIGMLVSIMLSLINYGIKDDFDSFIFYIRNIDFISWVEALFYIGYSSILSISFSFILNSFIKKNKNIIITSAIIILINIFFIGNIPYSKYMTNDVFWGFKFISIYSFTSINGWISFSNGGAFMFEQNFLNYIGHIEKLMNFTIPFIIISICCGLSSHFFRWKLISDKKHDDLIVISKSKVIINIVWVIISVIIVIIGATFLVISNHEKILSISNWEYILGSAFVILGIINTSLSVGYLVKNMYLKIYNSKLLKQ